MSGAFDRALRTPPPPVTCVHARHPHPPPPPPPPGPFFDVLMINSFLVLPAASVKVQHPLRKSTGGLPLKQDRSSWIHEKNGQTCFSTPALPLHHYPPPPPRIGKNIHKRVTRTYHNASFPSPRQARRSPIHPRLPFCQQKLRRISIIRTLTSTIQFLKARRNTRDANRE